MGGNSLQKLSLYALYIIVINSFILEIEDDIDIGANNIIRIVIEEI